MSENKDKYSKIVECRKVAAETQRQNDDGEACGQCDADAMNAQISSAVTGVANNDSAAD